MSYQLGYCEIYKPQQHGTLNNHDTYYLNKKYIYTSFLNQLQLSLDDFYDTSECNAQKEWELNGPWLNQNANIDLLYNPYIRNTTAIKINDLNIIDVIYYENYEFCILKTVWLKIFQRIWKKYYKNKIAKKMNIKNILNRSIYGKWA